MSNPTTTDIFNRCIESYRTFQELAPDLLSDHLHRSYARHLLLDQITKIIISKKSLPSHRFYALYFILKAAESKNEDFIKDLAHKDELTMKIFHASQTDATKSDMPFERGTNYFSVTPSYSEAKAGINFVKLSIELIMSLDQAYGDPSPKNTKHIFRMLASSLQRKTKISKVIWFCNRKYIIPDDQELYNWDFNKKSPLLASQSLALALLGPVPLDDEELEDLLENGQLEEEVAQEIKLELFARAQTIKNTGLNKGIRSRHSPFKQNDSVSSIEHEETLSSSGHFERHGLMLTTAPRQTRFSRLGLIDRKEYLRGAILAGSDSTEEKFDKEQKPRQSFITNISKFQDKITLENQNNFSESGSTPASTKEDLTPTELSALGPNITVQRGAEVKKGAMKKSGFSVPSKHVLWADTESSPSVCEEANEKQERVHIQRKGTRQITFNAKPQEDEGDEAMEPENLIPEESTPKINIAQIENNDEIEEKAGISERRSIMVPRIKVPASEARAVLTEQKELTTTERDSRTPIFAETPSNKMLSPRDLGLFEKAGISERRSIMVPHIQVTASEPMPIVTDQKELTVTGRNSRTPIFADTPSHKMLGPKDLGLFNSITTSRENLKGRKTPNLQADLQAIENSIRLSMVRTSNVSSVRSERMSSGSAVSLFKSPLLLDSKKFVDTREAYLPRPTKLFDSSSKQEIYSNRRISTLSSFSGSIRLDTDPGQVCESEPSFRIDSSSSIGNKSNNRAEDDLMKWKCVVVERANPPKQESFLQELNSSKGAQKMYSVTGHREIEVREDDSLSRKGNVQRENNNFVALGKENSGPVELRRKKIRSDRAVSNRMSELLAAYMSPDDSKQCLQRVMRPSKYL